MATVTPAFLKEQLQLADELLAGRSHMLAPQDLPGRYGRVVRAVDHVLQATNCTSVLAGGWAVWHHGFVGRVTQDLDIVVPAALVDELLRVAGVSGFQVLARPEGRWPKLLHKDTDVEVDLLPEGGRPGTAAHPAPTTIPHPSVLGAGGNTLQYIKLPALIELKMAAGRARDESDVVELVRVNPEQVEAIREHLAGIHADYVRLFDQLVQRAREQ